MVTILSLSHEIGLLQAIYCAVFISFAVLHLLIASYMFNFCGSDAIGALLSVASYHKFSPRQS